MKNVIEEGKIARLSNTLIYINTDFLLHFNKSWGKIRAFSCFKPNVKNRSAKLRFLKSKLLQWSTDFSENLTSYIVVFNSFKPVPYLEWPGHPRRPDVWTRWWESLPGTYLQCPSHRVGPGPREACGHPQGQCGGSCHLLCCPGGLDPASVREHQSCVLKHICTLSGLIRQWLKWKVQTKNLF